MKDFFTKSDLKTRGWTESMIDKLLGQPEKFGQNSHKKSTSVYLFLSSRVLEVEGSQEFKEWQKKTAPRRIKQSKSMLALSDTKRKQILEYVKNMEIDVPKLHKRQCIREACEHYNYRQYEREKYDFEHADPKNSSEDFLKRIAMNYIRHCLTDYEAILREMYGKVGIDSAYAALKSQITEEIYKANPWLNEQWKQDEPLQVSA